jgi:hypothetical protein
MSTIRTANCSQEGFEIVILPLVSYNSWGGLWSIRNTSKKLGCITYLEKQIFLEPSESTEIEVLNSDLENTGNLPNCRLLNNGLGD